MNKDSIDGLIFVLFIAVCILGWVACKWVDRHYDAKESEYEEDNPNDRS